MIISWVLAVGEDGAIGHANALPWKLPEDMKLFRNITLGGAVLMGRKTFESIGKPLPNRRNYVVTTLGPNSLSIDKVLQIARLKDEEEMFVIGGVSVYEATRSIVDRIYVTLVHASFPEADARMDASWMFDPDGEFVRDPTYSPIEQPVDERHAHAFTHMRLIRK